MLGLPVVFFTFAFVVGAAIVEYWSLRASIDSHRDQCSSISTPILCIIIQPCTFAPHSSRRDRNLAGATKP
ncbi:hypothetical protein BC629DRAFT_1538315 [Irpex lacteus]|nr:hypothetical protein BC629DRAFT_1538315 [Irpex lacteus]